MYRVGLSTNGKEINEELFRSYARGGVGQMELAMSAPQWYEINFKEIGKWAGEYGVNLWSMHLPFGYGAGTPFDPSEPEFCDETVQRHGELMKKGADIGIDKFVIHASLENIDDDHRRMRMDCAKDSMARLAKIARDSGVTVAVEALPRTCLGRISAEMAELTGVDDSLRVCFDTNHIMLEDNADYIRKVGDKIITLHVSDFDYIRERHWLPGEGEVDWRGVLDALSDVGYGGVWMYEVAFKAPDTIIRERDLIPEDFVRNAREIFSGASPTLISRVNPELYK